MVASRDNFSLLAELLAEQQRLDTPVARFSSAFDTQPPARLAPQLIPLTAPRPGEQYAFEVDLDSCTGCKSCVAACHSLNGLDETETWREVGLLVSDKPSHPFTQTITSSCHHCADPACLNGCPVLAYEKDPLTGIVRHLDDQCIGCSYCVLKCPYDAPKYSSRLGIVRKCDMCHGRLAHGEAPACAQACPTHAIRIVTVSPATDGVPAFLPGAPAPAYTRPTTRYTSARPLPANIIPADAAVMRPQPAHWPLVLMLTLLPAALGFNVLAAAVPYLGHPPAIKPAAILAAAIALAAMGLAASVLHLGQPLRAWRIFLGWRKSWLSREALVFGVWFPVLVAAAFVREATLPAAVIGTVALFCSAMIYVDTQRPAWRLTQTAPRFFGTTLFVAAALLSPVAGVAALALKFVWEIAGLMREPRTRSLFRGLLRGVIAARLVLYGIGVGLLMAFADAPLSFPVLIGLLFVLGGELLDRLLFFRAVDAPKMPGLPAS